MPDLDENKKERKPQHLNVLLSLPFLYYKSYVCDFIIEQVSSDVQALCQAPGIHPESKRANLPAPGAHV